jgi:riboflavin kinase/FMN adenylyltransferase
VKISRGIPKLGQRKKTVLAIGVFDGVHLGHQAVLQKVIRRARALKAIAAVLTFEAAPEKVIAPGYAPASITTLGQKLELIAKSGIRLAAVARFDRRFASQTPEAFVLSLVRRLRIKEVVVGSDFVFGAHAEGNAWLLRRLGVKFDYRVHVMKARHLEGRPISSTRIRAVLASGKIAEVARMLGRPFTISGRIAKGDQLGRKLGYPTANMEQEQEALPLRGVWGARARVLPKGPWHPTLVNLGTRPTLNGKNFRTELHLLDFKGDLYGRRLEVEFTQFLRHEKRFDNLDALKQQIRLDEVHFRRSTAFHSVSRNSGA